MSNYLIIFITLFTFVYASTNIRLPPRVSTPQPQITVKEGDTNIELECDLDVGDDPVAFRWFKQYKLVTADLGYAYRAFRKVHLALHQVTQNHAGVYECEAKNDAGQHATSIEVIVEPRNFYSPHNLEELPDTASTLSELSASLNDVLAHGDCECDVMFLMHVSSDAANESLASQANFVHTLADAIISDKVRVSVATYTDYVNMKLNFGSGTHSCALTNALKDLSHEKWATRIKPVLRDALKRFRKSKKKCKVLFIPIFGSLGPEGADLVVTKHLQKSSVTIFVLEVSPEPIPDVVNMASERGDGRPYHWWIPLKVAPTIVSYMSYMTEELNGCLANHTDIAGVCVSNGKKCSKSIECKGIGVGCIKGVCQSMECNVNPELAGCCTSPGEFWCGDVTLECVKSSSLCDGRYQCMNSKDEDNCWQIAAPCQKGEARCQSSTLCLSMYDLCDGEPHCPAAEDEDPKYCRSFPCPRERSFRCRNGKCITPERVCDGAFRDCADGEDENLEYCSKQHTCSAKRPFKCDYGVCVPETMVCDGAFNCLDALDERLCEERSCPPDRPFKCGNGKCVNIALICNGIVDACTDGSDEANCTSFVCPAERSFKCDSGRCIDKWLECDNRKDCDDGSDEKNCGETTAPPTKIARTLPPKPTKESCKSDEFFCSSGICLPIDKVCDGRQNCIDGEDEKPGLCREYSCPPEKSHKCDSGDCVQGEFCDGIEQCKDGSDEIDCDDEEEYNYYGEYTAPEMPDFEDPDIREVPEDKETDAETVDSEKDEETKVETVKEGSSGENIHSNIILLAVILISQTFVT